MQLQASLFATASGSTPSFALVNRRDLGAGAWIDTCPGWLPAADDVFATLHEDVAWRSERRQMYQREVAVPRLVATLSARDALPHAALVDARDALDQRYRDELGGHGFATAGCCLYRDGRDSVAWHGDRIGRGRNRDTVVAIVSVGAPRVLALRPRDGGRSMQIEMGHGDLLVMGGSCQRTFDHAVPKVSHAGPRISVQFRPHNVF